MNRITNVIDKIMSTSIILLDQTFNANYVDIMVFEPSIFFSPATVWGEIDYIVLMVGSTTAKQPKNILQVLRAFSRGLSIAKLMHLVSAFISSISRWWPNKFTKLKNTVKSKMQLSFVCNLRFKKG